MKRRDFLIGSAGGLFSLRALARADETDEPGEKPTTTEPEAAKADNSSAARKTDTSPMKSRRELITAETDTAISRGLAYLARKQQTRGKALGSFAGGTRYSGGVAVSSLAGLAFMCGGNTPIEGPYASHVRRSLQFVMGNVQESGFASVPGGVDRMYGHGFATLFLSQGMGMSHDCALTEKVKKAVKLIVETQNHAGGWRYEPVKSDADLSITVCQIMALRAARDAGVLVPDETRNKCIEYVKRAQNPDGSFRYQDRGGHSTFPLTAAGVVSLYSAGIYTGDPILKGLEWLLKHLPGKSSISSGYGYYFYGQYYAVQAMWHAGGKYWNTWYPAIRNQLLASQAGDGSWMDSSVGNEFGTAMACIILQVPNDYIPIFGR